MALTEVYEVATFYAHFDVVKEDELPPPPVTVRVCDSLSCAMAGPAPPSTIRRIKARMGKPRVDGVQRAPRQGLCHATPVRPIDRANT